MSVSKRVVVVASGETERRALPHLLTHLAAEGIQLVEVRIPARHHDLTPGVVGPLLRVVWFEWWGRGEAIDKIVVLVDADGADPIAKASTLTVGLQGHLRGIGAAVLVTAAKWHLEAWFFADSARLREYLGRNLGNVDTSAPDEIQNPKLHLKNLLGQRLYVAATAAEIAGGLSIQELRRSPSFTRFEAAMRNGGASPAGATASP